MVSNSWSPCWLHLESQADFQISRRRQRWGWNFWLSPWPRRSPGVFPALSLGKSTWTGLLDGLTLNCHYFVPLSQNTWWSLSMILLALCNPNLYLQMSIYSLLPSSPQNDAYAQALTFFPSLKFPPLSFYQSTSGPLTTSSTEQHYIFSRQCLTSLFMPFFLFGLLHLWRKHFH